MYLTYTDSPQYKPCHSAHAPPLDTKVLQSGTILYCKYKEAPTSLTFLVKKQDDIYRKRRRSLSDQNGTDLHYQTLISQSPFSLSLSLSPHSIKINAKPLTGRHGKLLLLLHARKHPSIFLFLKCFNSEESTPWSANPPTEY